MKIADALNKKLAIIAWMTDENGEDDAAVFTGVFIKQDSRYFLKRGEGEPSLEILNEWLPRIEPVFEDIREILLGAEYRLSLSVGSAVEEDGPFQETGLKWPKSCRT